MIKIFEKVQSHVQAIRFEGGRESGMEICKWVGSGSAYIPNTNKDPFDYVQVPTMFGPRDIEAGQWVVKIEEGTFITYKEEALMAEYVVVEDEEQRLIQHARVELSKFVDEDANFIESIINTVKAFSSYRGHSGASAEIAIHMVTALLKGENLLPLTNDEDEWTFHAGATYGVDYDMWQNKRNSKAMSHDGGKTYFLVNENRESAAPGNLIFHTSEDKNFQPEIDPEDLKSDEEKEQTAQVDEIASLIADMTLSGASESAMRDAVAYSALLIEAEKEGRILDPQLRHRYGIELWKGLYQNDEEPDANHDDGIDSFVEETP